MRQVWKHMWSKTRLKTVVVKSVNQEYHFSHTRKIPIAQLVWEKTKLHKNTMRQKSCCSIGVLKIWTNNTMRQIGSGSQSLVLYGSGHKNKSICSFGAVKTSYVHTETGKTCGSNKMLNCVTNKCTINTKRHIYKFCCCQLSKSGVEIDLTLRLHGVCIRSMISTECGKQNRKPQK